jgi:hypothetical protein
LITLSSGLFQSNEQYILVIASAKGKSEACYADKPITIDTKPSLVYTPISSGAGSLRSNVALSYPGDETPINLAQTDCLPKDKSCTNVVVDLYGAQISLRQIRFEKIDLAKVVAEGRILNPENIGQFSVKSRQLQAALTNITTRGGPGGTLINLSNVLAGPRKQPLILTEGSLQPSKAPATKALAWLWISGALTAGTGAAPAWVLDGKIDVPPAQFRGPLLIKWATATANIGNNKIDGMAAKDIIDFSSPSLTWLHSGKGLGTTFTLAPTYETNRELTHHNMLIVGDWVFSPNFLNQTQQVRIAEKYFSLRNQQAKGKEGKACSKNLPALKMPVQGDFKDCRFPKTGTSLTFHVGFETGGALSTTTVKNPNTKAVVGIIPTYDIGRYVQQFDGLYQFRNFSLESYLVARYLFSTEHTAVNNRGGVPYLETVSGWKAVNVLTGTYAPGANPHIKLNIAYTNGFSAPVYQRANGIRIGLGIAY